MKSEQAWLDTSFGFAGPRGTRVAHHAIAPTARLRGLGWSKAEKDRFARERDFLNGHSHLNRLADVSQVFYSSAPGVSKRLTHSVEVARIAGILSAELGLDVALAECIALCHDCGHAPFAHLGERFLQDRGLHGDHASWGSDLLSRSKSDLSPQLLDGIRSHPWTADPPSTAEGEIVSWSDRIAYLLDDLADAIAVGLIPPAEPPAPGFPSNLKEVLMDSIVRASSRLGVICIEAEAGFLLGTLRKTNWSRIYKHEAVRMQGLVAHEALAAVAALGAVSTDRPGLANIGRMSDTDVWVAAGITAADMDITRFLTTVGRSYATSAEPVAAAA